MSIKIGDKVYIKSIGLYGIVLEETETQYRINVFGGYGIFTAMKYDVEKC